VVRPEPPLFPPCPECGALKLRKHTSRDYLVCRHCFAIADLAGHLMPLALVRALLDVLDRRPRPRPSA